MPNYYQAQNATVVGDVTLEEGSSVWYGAVVRGDSAPIHIGAGTNIQDNATVHVDRSYPARLGICVTVGHNAVVHGCIVGDNTVVGMGAIIMDGAIVGRNCIIGAGSLVTQGTQIPDGYIAYGNPAKARRPVTPKEVASNRANAKEYFEQARNQLPAHKIS